MNNATIIGNLTRDPEIRFTSTNKAVAKFAVAVKREHGDGVDYIDCVAWNRTAEQIAQFLKGDKVFVTGHLKLDSWEDKKTGEKRSKLLVNAQIVAGQPKSDNAPERPKSAHSPETAMSSDGPNVAMTEDDIPF